MRTIKKMCLVFALALTVLAVVPAVANAATTQETEICKFVKEKNQVVDAQCVVYLRTCVVALKTEKFTAKSDYDTFREALEKEIAKKYSLDKVIVTRSPKAMHMIKGFSAMTEEQRDEAVRNFLEGFEHREPPLKQPK